MPQAAEPHSELIKALNIKSQPMERLTQAVADDLLRAAYSYGDSLGEEKEALNKKIRAVWLQWHGFEWVDDEDRLYPRHVVGAAGRDIRAPFEEAAKRVSEALEIPQASKPEPFRLDAITQKKAAQSAEIAIAFVDLTIDKGLDGEEREAAELHRARQLAGLTEARQSSAAVVVFERTASWSIEDKALAQDILRKNRQALVGLASQPDLLSAASIEEFRAASLFASFGAAMFFVPDLPALSWMPQSLMGKPMDAASGLSAMREKIKGRKEGGAEKPGDNAPAASGPR